MFKLSTINIYFRTTSGREYVQEQDVSGHDFMSTTPEALKATILEDTGKQLLTSTWWMLVDLGSKKEEQVWSGCFESYRVELVE